MPMKAYESTVASVCSSGPSAIFPQNIGLDANRSRGMSAKGSWMARTTLDRRMRLSPPESFGERRGETAGFD